MRDLHRTHRDGLFVCFSGFFGSGFFLENGFEFFQDVGRTLQQISNLLQNIFGICHAGIEHFNSAALVYNQKADRRDAQTGSATTTKVLGFLK